MRYLYRILMLIFSILILIAIVWYANPAAVFLALTKSNPLFIILAFAASNIAICIQVLKWWVLLKGVGFRELFPIQLLGITISNFTPGRVFEPLKAVILKLKNGTPVSETLPSIIWERIIDIIVVTVLSLFAIQVLALKSDIFLLSVISIIAFVVLICILFLILYNRKFGFKIFKILIKFPVLNRMTEGFLKRFYEEKIRSSMLLLSFVLSVTTWMIYGFSFYLSMLALGVEISPLLLTGILTLSIIVGVVSSLPGGIGSTDIVMVLLLGLLGVENVTAVTGVLITRFLSLWYSIFLGGLSFVYLSKKMGMKDIFIVKP